ncbi:MAG: ribonuclease P protein component [Ignavibacteriae bacterium]|nr:ribonuclease P protein component [Ignavibacteriota bacterium]MCB9208466.1 ribonuclease P protein component [Ignavibacteriales bacterium]MCB9258425.1 ribonuclease P protein component [Ignavibacteriales bacterium]
MKNFSLSKNERIKLKRDFQKVYTKGKILYSSQKKIKVNYYLESSVNEGGIKAAFVVSKKAGNAVWRNRVKRLLREAYRTNKLLLKDLCISKNQLLLMIFSPNIINQKHNKKIKLDLILDDLIGLLDKMKSKVQDA